MKFDREGQKNWFKCTQVNTVSVTFRNHLVCLNIKWLTAWFYEADYNSYLKLKFWKIIQNVWVFNRFFFHNIAFKINIS